MKQIAEGLGRIDEEEKKYIKSLKEQNKTEEAAESGGLRSLKRI